MGVNSPEEMLRKTAAYLDNIEKAKASHVAVGLPQENVGGKVYRNGMTIIGVGAVHEYGIPPNPRRSFLRVPFSERRDEMEQFIAAQFRNVAENGASSERALGLIGAKAQNISRGAFTTRGYGTWPDIEPETKRRKGSSQVLIDTGVLRGSISYVVRSA